MGEPHRLNNHGFSDPIFSQSCYWWACIAKEVVYFPSKVMQNSCIITKKLYNNTANFPFHLITRVVTL